MGEANKFSAFSKRAGEAAKPAGEGPLCLSYLASHPRTQVLSFMEMEGGVNQLHLPSHCFPNTIDNLANLVSCPYGSLCLISPFLSRRTQLKCHLLWEASLDSPTWSPWLLLLCSQGLHQYSPSTYCHVVIYYMSVSLSKWGAPRGRSSALLTFTSPAPNKGPRRERTHGQTQRWGHSEGPLL